MPNILSTSPSWARKYLNLKWRLVFELDFSNSNNVLKRAPHTFFTIYFSKNEQMLTEGELSMVEDSDRVRELQDRIGDLKAEVIQLPKLPKLPNFTIGY